MKRLVLFLGLAALIMLVPMTHAQAKKGGGVDLCHMDSESVVMDLGYVVVNFGEIITVKGKAERDHLAHGDSEVFTEMDAAYVRRVEIFFGIDVKDANCVFGVSP